MTSSATTQKGTVRIPDRCSVFSSRCAQWRIFRFLSVGMFFPNREDVMNLNLQREAIELLTFSDYTTDSLGIKRDDELYLYTGERLYILGVSIGARYVDCEEYAKPYVLILNTSRPASGPICGEYIAHASHAVYLGPLPRILHLEGTDRSRSSLTLLRLAEAHRGLAAFVPTSFRRSYVLLV